MVGEAVVPARKIDDIWLYSNQLRQKSVPLTEFGPVLEELRDRLIQTNRKYNGAGVAAPQIGVFQRIAVLDLVALCVDPSEYGLNSRYFCMVNPEIVDSRGPDINEHEGCLSIPGEMGNPGKPPYPVRAVTKRQKFVELRYQDVNGSWHTVGAEKIFARGILHEVDHLNGTLFVDHLSGVFKDIVMRKHDKFVRQLKRSNAKRG